MSYNFMFEPGPEELWLKLFFALVVLSCFIAALVFITQAEGCEPNNYTYSAQYIPPHIQITNEILSSANLVLIPTNLAGSLNSNAPYLRKGGKTLINGVTSVANCPLYFKSKYFKEIDFEKVK